MRNFYQASKVPFALTSLCLMLSACGGGSNTINENPAAAGGSTNAVVECSSSDNSCVDIIFDDTPVVNLNYECGRYRSVTSNTGVARCPVDSNVTFYLKADNGNRKIVFGTVPVKPVRNPISSEIQDTVLIRVTPKDLAESVTGSTLNSLDESAVAKTAVNMSLLLQSIARTNRLDANKGNVTTIEPYISTAPVNRVYIDREVKTDIDKITEDVNARDFQDNTFVSKTRPWLEAQKISLISTAEAKRRLEQVILATNAGVFFATPTLDTSGLQNQVVDLKLGVSGTGSSNNIRATVAMFALADRSGNNTGYGLEWIAPTSASQNTTYAIYLQNKYSKMRLAQDAGIINPYNNRFNNFMFNIGPKAFTEGPDANTYNGNTFRFINGKLIRDLAVLASPAVYQLYNIKAVEDNTELGTWEQKNTIGATNFSGTATVFKRASVNTYLDPVIWRVKELVATGQTYQFPLYATLTINYNPECNNCSSVSLPIAILENGDIVTDARSETNIVGSEAVCGAAIAKLDSAGRPLTDSIGNPVYIKQKVIGTIRAAYTSSDGAQLYLSPNIILAGEQFGVLDGTLIGIGESVKINLAGIRNVAANQRGSINATSASNVLDDNGNIITIGINNTNPAIWVNTYNSYTHSRVEFAAQNQQAANQNANLEPIENAEKIAATKDYGALQVNTSPCYRVLQK